MADMSVMKTSEFLMLGIVSLAASCSMPSTPPQMVKSLQKVDCSNLTQEQMSAVAKAREDHQRVSEGKPPLHAKAEGFLNDGGTICYKGQGYNLIAWHKIEKRQGRNVYRTGPLTTLQPEITGGRTIECESVSYTPRP